MERILISFTYLGGQAFVLVQEDTCAVSQGPGSKLLEIPGTNRQIFLEVSNLPVDHTILTHQLCLCNLFTLFIVD